MVICQHAVLSRETAPDASWKYRILPHAYRLLLPRIGAIVAVSDGAADDFARVCAIPRARVTRIYNPVLDAEFTSRAAEVATHPWFDEPIPVFVSAARLEPVKDYPTLLHGFARHRRRHQARLFIMGVGSEQANLMALARTLGIEADVCFAGFVANPLPFIRNAAALVSASRFEGFGVAIVELLACGTPVIATDCPGGPAEILGHGRFGRLVPVGDPAALATALKEDLRAAWPREVLQSRAETFSVDASVEAYLDLFRSLIPDRGARSEPSLQQAPSSSSVRKPSMRRAFEQEHQPPRLADTGEFDRGPYPATPEFDGSASAVIGLTVAIFKFRRRILVCMAIIVLLAIGLALMSRKDYVAKSAMLATMSADYGVRPDAGSPGNPSGSLTQEEIVRTERDILGNDQLHRAVLREIGPANIYPSRPARIGVADRRGERPSEQDRAVDRFRARRRQGRGRSGGGGAAVVRCGFPRPRPPRTAPPSRSASRIPIRRWRRES